MQEMRTTLKPIIVAICGDSGSGKTTLTDCMVRVFGHERITHICLDDYHTLDRAARLRTSITALSPEANNIALMTEHLRQLARGESVVKPVYDHKTGTFAEPERVYPSEIIIAHGLLPLFTEELRNLAHVRIYLDPETALLQQWKIYIRGRCAMYWRSMATLLIKRRLNLKIVSGSICKRPFTCAPSACRIWAVSTSVTSSVKAIL